jgi:site-specific DNA recombinase
MSRAPKWGVARRPGHHEALISPSTFALIQERLGGVTRAPARVDMNSDFPLRGAVFCAHCRSPLTAGWFKGKCDTYAYYLCNRRGCPMSRKCIPRHEIESQFDALLDPLRAAPALSHAVRPMFAELWSIALTRAQREDDHLAAKSQALERHLSRFRDRIAAGTDASLRTLYESRIRALQGEYDRFLSHRAQRTRRRPDFEQSLSTTLAFLERPSHLWRSGTLEYRRAVLKHTFSGQLFYSRGLGFRTPEVACLFRPVTSVSPSTMHTFKN